MFRCNHHLLSVLHLNTLPSKSTARGAIRAARAGKNPSFWLSSSFFYLRLGFLRVKQRSFDLCGFNRLNDEFGAMMLPLRRFRATSPMASICPLLAWGIISFRCFPLLLKHAQRKGRCCWNLDCLAILDRFRFVPLVWVVVPERKTILPPRLLTTLDFTVPPALHEGMVLTDVDS